MQSHIFTVSVLFGPFTARPGYCALRCILRCVSCHLLYQFGLRLPGWAHLCTSYMLCLTNAEFLSFAFHTSLVLLHLLSVPLRFPRALWFSALDYLTSDFLSLQYTSTPNIRTC